MKKSFLILSLLCVVTTIYAQETGLTSEIKEHINALVDTQNSVGIVVGFIDGKSVQYFSAGKTNLKYGTDVNEETVFEIGSISKVFTTTLLADLYFEGEMEIVNPISNYLPKHVKVPTRNGEQITIYNLATHSSGLPRMPSNFNPKNANNPFADYTYTQLYDFLSNHTLTRDIGSQYEYSNLGMGLLGHILELNTNETYDELLDFYFRKELEMEDTSLFLSESMKKRLAKGHDGLREVENWDIVTLAGAGGIRSTASDMVKFVKANMGLSETYMEDAMKLAQKTAYSNADGTFKMGLGWHYENDGRIIWHNGRTGGYSSFIGFLKDSNKGVVVLSNSTYDIGALSFKILGLPAPLIKPKKSMAALLKKEIETNGNTPVSNLLAIVKSKSPEAYRTTEDELNALGYEYLNNKNIDAALALFKLNVELHPNASNPYDSLGEVYLKKGDTERAITNYKKALEINPANENAKKVLKSLGVSDAGKEVNVSQEVLNTYVGKYELAPNFVITITKKEKQLFLQATGQPQFEIFASAQNKFYLKVVEASVSFNSDDAGKITSLTLHQGGQNVPGKKIE